MHKLQTHLHPQRHLELVQAEHLLHGGGRLRIGRILLVGQQQHGHAKQLPARQRPKQRRPRLLKPARMQSSCFWGVAIRNVKQTEHDLPFLKECKT